MIKSNNNQEDLPEISSNFSEISEDINNCKRQVSKMELGYEFKI